MIFKATKFLFLSVPRLADKPPATELTWLTSCNHTHVPCDSKVSFTVVTSHGLENCNGITATPRLPAAFQDNDSEQAKPLTFSIQVVSWGHAGWWILRIYARHGCSLFVSSSKTSNQCLIMFQIRELVSLSMSCHRFHQAASPPDFWQSPSLAVCWWRASVSQKRRYLLRVCVCVHVHVCVYAVCACVAVSPDVSPSIDTLWSVPVMEPVPGFCRGGGRRWVWPVSSTQVLPTSHVMVASYRALALYPKSTITSGSHARAPEIKHHKGMLPGSSRL